MSALLSPAAGAQDDFFGYSTALSADGLTAIVGGIYADTELGIDRGSARVFLWDGTRWVQRGRALAPPNSQSSDKFGYSVAISTDGLTVIVGGPADFSSSQEPIGRAGSAYVFVWMGTDWTQLGGALRPTDANAGDWFGSSVSLSADGLTAIVGGPGDDFYREETGSYGNQGSGRVFVWTGTAWAQRGGPLTPADGAAGDSFGNAVSLSADGLTAIIGGAGDDVGSNIDQGSARVFVWSGTGWTQRGATIVAQNGSAGDLFGHSVSLSADGLTAIVGRPSADVGSNANQGAAEVFGWDGTSWVQRGGKITPAFGSAGDEFGVSVALSADGLTAVIGAPGDDVASNADQGSARVFMWDGVNWIQRGEALTPADGAPGDIFGRSVALSADGLVAIVGGPFDDVGSTSNQGSARVFVWNGTAWDEGGGQSSISLLSLAPPPTPKLEGNSGNTSYDFKISRTGSTSQVSSANWSVTGVGSNSASTADFVGNMLPNGTVTFEVGEKTKTITVFVAADTEVEFAENFVLKLSDASAGTSINIANAIASIQNDDASLVIDIATPIRAEGNQGSAGYTFTVTRDGYTNQVSSAAWAAVGITNNPASDTDFVGAILPGGIVTFGLGETTKTITVPVAGDNDAENNEIFSVILSNASVGTSISLDTATGMIQNDDAFLIISSESKVISEGNTGSIAYALTVSRGGYTNQTSEVYWTVAGTGSDPASASDFVGGVFPGGNISFGPGETIKTINLQIAGDSSVEPNEGFVVSLSGASGGTSIRAATATSAIQNDDTSMSIVSASTVQTEGSGGSTAFTFTVSRRGDVSGSATVNYSVLGSGTSVAESADFYGSIFPSGTISFAAGETSQTLIVPVEGDSAVEADEGFTVRISAAAGGIIAIDAATGTILNDDLPRVLSLARLQAGRAEGQSGSTAFTFLATRTGDVAAAANASWTVTGGTAGGTVAANGADFVGGILPNGVVSFAAGQASKTITVNVAGDAAAEGGLNESFTVTLANPSGGMTLGTPSAVGLIYNDDSPGTGTLAIARSSAQKAEGQSGTTAFTFTVTRAGDLTGTAGADWAVTGGGVSSTVSANAADFAGGILPSGRVNFGAGQGLTTITVNVAADGTIELNDSFTVTLAAPQLGVTIGTAAATGVILNDDFPPSGVFSIAGLQADRGEGASGSTAFTFVVTRAGNIAGPASANWAATAGTASAADFTGGILPSGSVTFAPGQASQVVTLTVAGDTTAEADETFTVALSGVPAGVSIGTATATGTIRNDDPAGTGTLAIARASAQKAESAAGTTPFTFTVTRSGDLSGVAAADWAVSGGGVSGTTAATGADFATGQFPSGRVTFAAGQAVQTVEVNVAAEVLAEKNESFTVALSNAQAGVAVSTASATGVIVNDDFASTSASQTLTGTTGPDVFLLGGGLDSVVAKAGLDLFRFLPTAIGPAASNATTLQDFSRVAGEVMDLSAIDAIAGSLADDAFSFIGTAAFTAAGQLRWQDQGTVRLIQGEVTGDGIADLTILVKSPGPIDSTWFAL